MRPAIVDEVIKSIKMCRNLENQKEKKLITWVYVTGEKPRVTLNLRNLHFFCVVRPQARACSLSLSVSLVHIAMAYAQLMQPLGNIRTWKFNKKKKTKERNHVIAKWGTTSMAKFERITSLDTQTANKQTQLADLR